MGSDSSAGLSQYQRLGGGGADRGKALRTHGEEIVEKTDKRG